MLPSAGPGHLMISVEIFDIPWTASDANLGKTKSAENPVDYECNTNRTKTISVMLL